MQYVYGYEDLYPLLNDIRIVIQLANATAAESDKKAQTFMESTLRPGINPNCRNACTETINARAMREHSLFCSGLYFEISDVPAYKNK